MPTKKDLGASTRSSARLASRELQKGRGSSTDFIIRTSLAANLVYALDRIQQIVSDDPVDVFPLSKAWMKRDNTSPSLALEIRTQVFIQTLAAQPGEPDATTAIYSVLCASDDNKDNSNHDAGPNDIVGTFESLFYTYTGETEEGIQDITSSSKLPFSAKTKSIKVYGDLKRTIP
ncbi:hypothetical protein E4U10_006155 [Claviceps purpurea]|nr:hypothetical protein E4U51_002614 [Claviceps purpurea]KAG6198787.1 hypothetical protein E4U10_006155 [Claviceps purpurea]